MLGELAGKDAVGVGDRWARSCAICDSHQLVEALVQQLATEDPAPAAFVLSKLAKCPDSRVVLARSLDTSVSG